MKTSGKVESDVKLIKLQLKDKKIKTGTIQ
jgi:hypothetical protein